MRSCSCSTRGSYETFNWLRLLLLVGWLCLLCSYNSYWYLLAGCRASLAGRLHLSALFLLWWLVFGCFVFFSFLSWSPAVALSSLHVFFMLCFLFLLTFCRFPFVPRFVASIILSGVLACMLCFAPRVHWSGLFLLCSRTRFILWSHLCCCVLSYPVR